MTHPALAQIYAYAPLQAEYAAMAEVLRRHQRFVVVAHQSPDGDALGSTLALCHVLWALGKEAIPFNVDPVPFNLEFLRGAERILDRLDPSQRPDCTILMDCAQPERIGAAFPACGWGGEVAVIDHHQTWDPTFAHHYLRDLKAAAVGEMVFRLALLLDAPMTEGMVQCCYVSILSDTGGFRYGKTSPTTFQIASHLIALGADPWEISSSLYENDPVERVRLLAKVLDTLTLGANGRLAFLTVQRTHLDDMQASPELMDGFINYARRIRGVEVATQLTELGPDRYRVSFRSRGKVNVASLAEGFGGGGHHNAAGCTVTGPLSEVQRRLSESLEALLRQEDDEARLVSDEPTMLG